MSKQCLEINCETGEEILRDFTAAEIKQIKTDNDADAQKKIAEAEKNAPLIEARLALLAKLGITSEEAALLLG